MRGTVLAATILATQTVLPAHSQERKPWDVTQLCGRVEYVQRMPVRKSADTFVGKREAIPGLVVELYESAQDQSRKKPIDSARTDKRGQFHLGVNKSGRYWLSMNWNQCRECGVAVVLNPGKGQTSCSGQGIGIDDTGAANWWTTITVD